MSLSFEVGWLPQTMPAEVSISLCLSLKTVAATTREHPVPLLPTTKTYAKMPRHCWDKELECHVLENRWSPILNPPWTAWLTSFPAGRQSFFGSYKWSSLPTAQPQCWQRRLYGKWTPLFSSVRRSRKQTKQRAFVQARCLCSHQVQQALGFWLAVSLLHLKTYPLLPIAVFHIVNPSVIPLNSDP